MSIFSFFYGTFFASRGRAAPWPLGLVGCLHVLWGNVHPHAYFYLLSFFYPLWDGKGCQVPRDCLFSFPFMALLRGWTSQKESFSLSSSGLQKKNHIFSYCHCCCHMKFSNLTISVLCDVFTYFITSHWSCCFSWVRACVSLLLLNTHTDWRNDLGHCQRRKWVGSGGPP